MKDLNRILLEAHVAHELDRFQNGSYRNAVEEEIGLLFDWIQGIKLEDIATPEEIVNLIQRVVVDLPVSGGITELIGEMSRNVFTADINRETSLEDIFARKQFDDIIDKLAGMKNLRDAVIDRLVKSSAYLTLISNVMYQTVKGYLLSENLLAQKAPMLYSLIQFGGSAVIKKIPGLAVLEAAIDRRLEAYVERTLDKTIQNSKSFLKDFIDENLIVETGEEIRQTISKGTLSGYFDKINTDDLEDFIIIGFEFWLHFRNTEYFQNIFRNSVAYFFEKYGDRNLDLIIEDMGVTREMVIREFCEVFSPGLEKALSTGYVEERIRARLESFYLSEHTAELINQAR